MFRLLAKRFASYLVSVIFKIATMKIEEKVTKFAKQKP